MAAIQSPQTMAILMQTTVIISHTSMSQIIHLEVTLTNLSMRVTCASTVNTEHLLTPPQLYACSIVSFTLQLFERCSASVTALTTIHRQVKLHINMQVVSYLWEDEDVCRALVLFPGVWERHQRNQVGKCIIALFPGFLALECEYVYTCLQCGTWEWG